MPGWKNMNYRHSLLLLLMILFSPLLQAQAEQEDEIASLDLLEFLGEWETGDGQWLDPADLEDNDFAKLMSLTEEENE